MFELTPFAGEVVFCVIVGLIGWLIFGDFRLRDFSWSEATESVFTATKRVLRAPSVILLTFDDQSPTTRWWVIFFVVQNPIPFLGFPLQLLHIPHFNFALGFFWGMTWVLCIIFLNNNRNYLATRKSGELLYETLSDCFGVSWLLGIVLMLLFDPNQVIVVYGRTPFDAQPFSSSPGELLIAAFFLFPYLGFIGYLAQRHFFVRKIEQRKIDDPAFALISEGYSIAAGASKGGYEKVLSKVVEIDLWKGLFPNKLLEVKGEYRSLQQLELRVFVENGAVQFENRYVFHAEDCGWRKSVFMEVFDVDEYRDWERNFIQLLESVHPLELQRDYLDLNEEDVRAHYANSGRAKIYELLF